MTVRIAYSSLLTATLALSMGFSWHLIWPAQAQTPQLTIPEGLNLQNGNTNWFAPPQNSNTEIDRTPPRLWNNFNPSDREPIRFEKPESEKPENEDNNWLVPPQNWNWNTEINRTPPRISNPFNQTNPGIRQRIQLRPLDENWLRQFQEQQNRELGESLRQWHEQQEQKKREQEQLLNPSNYQIPELDPETSTERKANNLLKEGIENYRINRFDAAIKAWEKALSLYRQINRINIINLAPIHKNLGKAYHNLGQYANAIENFESSLAIFRERPNQKGEVEALMSLGDTYNDLGQSAKANKLYEQSLTIASNLGLRDMEIQLKSRLGKENTNIPLEKGLEVIQLLEEFRDMARDTGDRHTEVRSLNDLGQAYLSMGKKTKAILLYNDALVLAREIKDLYNEAHTLKNLGDAYFFLWGSRRAQDFYNQALSIFRKIGDRRSEGDILNNLGEGLLKTGNIAAAEKHLFDAIAIWEMLRSPSLSDQDKVSLFDTQQTTYHLLQQVLIAQNKFETALEVAERGRARAFLELLSQRLTLQPISLDKALGNSETACGNNQNSCNSPNAITPPQIEQIKQIARTQNATLVQYSIITERVEFKVQKETKESEIYIWVVKPTGEIEFRRTNLKPLWQEQNTSLKDLVLSSRDSMGVRGRGIAVTAKVENTQTQAQKLQQLHQLLIEPIADLLLSDQNSRVIFIPQSELFLVPFPALQDKEGKYLIEKHTILTSPAIQLLDLTRKQRQLGSGTDIVVVGNPTMPSIPSNTEVAAQQLPSLPGAEIEAKEIAQLFNTTAITGKEATKANILAQLPKAKIIHLATHGLLDDFQGLGVPGTIALAPFGQDNGLLGASEILNLKLQAELVVLSACDTGRGQITGDGVIGLSRSFIVAGTPSVIVSLWAVPDSPTASLMTEFYQNLQNNLDKAQALRQAMLKALKQNPEPKNWAAFTLIGEAE